MSISRRRFGLGAAGMALAAGSRPARAAGQVVVGTWGGDYQDLQQKYVADALMAPQGINAVYDTANDTVRKTKLMAERRLPRGSVDVQALTASGSYEMFQNGAIAALDFSKIPNAPKILPALRTEYAVPHIYTGRVILYNPKLIKTPPTSYADLWAPENAGKVGVIDIQYQTTIESAAMIAGGGLSDYEPGKGKLLELKKSGVKIYPTNEAMAQALKTEDVGMCIMWRARGVQWRNAGIPVEMVYPKEGVVLYISEQTIAKNARNPEAAYAYLNALLDSAPQAAFARDFGYTPTVQGVVLPPEIEAKVSFPPEVSENFLVQDQAYLAKNDPQLQEWWNKVFKG